MTHREKCQRGLTPFLPALLIARNCLLWQDKGEKGLAVFKRKMILACFILAGIGLGLPLGIALLAPEASPVGAKADLIMVFPGTPQRIAAGFQLAQAWAASKLAISGLGQKDLEAQAARFGNPAGVALVASPKSRSTFEDVFNTRAMVRQHGARSLLLVTSAWHMPRSSFLLQCFLFGSGVTVQVVPVEDPRINTGASEAWQLQAKLALNEAVKFWGSATETTWSILTGSLLRDVPGFHELSTSLKRKFLFADT